MQPGFTFRIGTMLEIVFWISALATSYSYFGYPLLLWLVSRFYSHPTCEESFKEPPPISLIISAFNEKSNIAAKLANTAELDYDKSRLEVIVTSDASNDGTDQVVLDYPLENLRLLRQDERKGKESAQALAVASAKGDILVFSDAGTRLPIDALTNIVDEFRDSTVGAVSSEDRFISDDGSTVGEGAYVRYEMALRRLESKVNSLVGLSGSFFAARREVCENWRTDIPSDFNTAINAVQMGYRAVSGRKVFGIYRDIKDSQKEYARKVRTVLRGITALRARAAFLISWHAPLFSFQLFSHKAARWLVPWAMVSCLVSSALLARESGIYVAALVAQAAVYICALAGHFIPPVRSRMPFSICYFFVMANVAIAEATVRYVLGERVVIWQPSKR